MSRRSIARRFRFMSSLHALAAALLLSGGCSSSTPSAAGRARALRFELQDLHLAKGKVHRLQTKVHGKVMDETVATDWWHEGVIVAQGDARAIAGRYAVFLQVERVSGGNADSPRRYPIDTYAVVSGGHAPFFFYSGTESDRSPWVRESVRVEIMGYARLDSASTVLPGE